MNSLDVHAPLELLLKRMPGLGGFLEKLGIGPGHGPERSLTQVCREQRLDLQTVVRVLAALGETMPKSQVFTLELMTLTELCEHIESAHHSFLSDELARLDGLIDAVARQHGGTNPRFKKIQEIFTGFRQNIAVHLRLEAEVLFPLVRQLEAGEGERSGALLHHKRLLRHLGEDHNEAEEELSALCTFTKEEGWSISRPMQMLHDGFSRLERELHEQIYKENQALCPRALSILR